MAGSEVARETQPTMSARSRGAGREKFFGVKRLACRTGSPSYYDEVVCSCLRGRGSERSIALAF
jgi:hypothetical protein